MATADHNQNHDAPAALGRTLLSGLAVSGPRVLLVVIPALNESATIAQVVSRVPDQIDGLDEVRIIVVDDGSKDDTAALARQAGARVVSHDSPRGVGAVFHRALELLVEEGADILVFIDGDGQFNPNDIPKIVHPIVEGRADCVTASRYHPDASPQRQTLGRRLGNHLMSGLLSMLIRRRLYDVACGFRAYSAETAMSLNLTGRFTYTQETLLDVALKGGRIVEVPVRVRGTRKHGKSRVAHSLWRYGARAMLIIFRAYRDYKPLRFFAWTAVVLLVIALALTAMFLVQYIKHGTIRPQAWAVMAAGFMYVLTALTTVTGVLADMLDRIRAGQERLLFYERLRRFELRKTQQHTARTNSGTSAKTERHG